MGVLLLKKALGDRLKELRESRNLNQKEAATRFGITNFQLSRYETGKANPDPDLIAKFADFYDVSTDYLLGRTDVRNPDKKPEGRFFYDLENASKEDVDKLEEYFRFLQEQKKKREHRE